MLLIQSTSTDPARNGELEKKYLTEPPPQDVLLFYINRPSVIVGRNQSVEAEINIPYCQKHGIQIYRRISGGGAVYHDFGNINYAFIRPKKDTPVLEIDFATPIIKSLQSWGINAVVGQRKELLIDGKKISGTASHVTRDRILFHGTLLHHSDLSHLKYALQGSQAVCPKKVASVPSPVMNLSEMTIPLETTQDFLKKLIRFFEAYYQTEAFKLPAEADSINFSD